MAGIVDRADRAQRRVPVIGLPLAVFYKFFDDQGNYLAAMITYYAFVAIFPLLLLGTSILGFVLQGDPALEKTVLDSALGQFPVIGDDLNTPDGLTGSVSTVVVSTLIALYGSIGLGSALQNAVNVAWSVPRNSRPNPVLLRLKSLLLLMAAGLALIAVTAVTIVAQVSDVLAVLGSWGGWVVTGLSTVVLASGLAVVFRLAAAKSQTWARSLPGAFLVAVGWQVLQVASTAYINRVVAETSSVNQTFGVVLGLVGVIFIAALIAVLGIELNVVLSRRLWPRALLTPFTDSVDLTDADRRAYASYARAQRHKGFEVVDVDFGVPPHREPDDEARDEPRDEPREDTPDGPLGGSPKGHDGDGQRVVDGGPRSTPEGSSRPV